MENGNGDDKKTPSETASDGWMKVKCPQNLCFDELSSLSTYISRDLESNYSSLEQNIRQKLERQNRRKFLSRRCRFNIALVQVTTDDSESDVSTLRQQMLDSWIQVEMNEGRAGKEYIYQVAHESEFFQVSILETTLNETLLSYCEMRLNEYLYRKMTATAGADECVHVCVCLFPSLSLEKLEKCETFRKELQMMKKLNDIVSIVPVMSQIEHLDPTRIPSMSAKLRNLLVKEVKVFDDWFGQALNSTNGCIPEDKEGFDEPKLNSPLIPGPDVHLFAPAVVMDNACSSDEAPLPAGEVQADVIKKLRSQVLSCPLIVDCVNDFTEQDSRYKLPRFDSFPPMSCDFLRTVLIEGCSLVLMERTKTLFGSIAERKMRENEERHKFDNVHSLIMSGVILLAATVSFLKR